MTKHDIYFRVLAIQQTLDVQDGEDWAEALRAGYMLASGLLDELHEDLSKEQR